MRKIANILLLMGLFLTACHPSALSVETQPSSTSLSIAALTPFYTSTSTPAKPTATIKVSIPVTPSPTPTPFLHTITDEDTMLGLAIRYGVPLEAMKTANPAINPNAMTVGAQLVIPIIVETPQEIATPSPEPVILEQPICTKTGDGSTWCIVAVRNDSRSSLENLSVWIGLYDLQGNNFLSQIAYSPLNILRPDSVMPIMAYFRDPLPDKFIPRAELLTASAIAAEDQRYLDVGINLDQVAIHPAGSQVTVQGDVILPQGSKTPSQVWILAIAYDASGNIVGVRKWKSAGDTHFDTTVYSLGGPIDHVDVLAEVRP